MAPGRFEGPGRGPSGEDALAQEVRGGEEGQETEEGRCEGGRGTESQRLGGVAD